MGNTLQKPNESRQNQPGEEEGGGDGGDGGTFFTCEICIEPVAANNRFSNNDLCSHPFCRDCIARYIEVKFQDDYTAQIECPGLDCKHNLDILSCKPMIPSSLFLKWCDVLCEDYVLGFERCYCPNRECMALVVNECERDGEVKKAKCPICKQWFCFQCKLKWHAGYRCEESVNLRDRNDILFGQLVEQMNWVRCPGCGHCVQRITGCSSVLCRCKTRFCYKCGRKILLGCSCTSSTGCNYWMPVVLIAVLVACFVILIRGVRYCVADHPGGC